MWTTNGDDSFFCENNMFAGRKIWSNAIKVNRQTYNLRLHCENVATLLSILVISTRFGGCFVPKPSKFLEVASHDLVRDIAISSQEGTSPGIFWLGGYNSDMFGGKANALSELCEEAGHAFTRFDYTAHGQSNGDFMQACISVWLADAISVFEEMCDGPQVLVGSSMGGWLAMLLNQHIKQKYPDRIKAMILIAPAIDMTRELVPNRFTQEQLSELDTVGHLAVPSAYSDEPYIYTLKLITDGEEHLLLNKSIKTDCPVHIIQGQQDPDVPAAHAQRLLQHILLDEATLTLVPDGDHRLSRPQDLELLKRITHSFVTR